MKETLRISAVAILALTLAIALWVVLTRIGWEKGHTGFRVVVRAEQAADLSLHELAAAGIDTIAISVSTLLSREEPALVGFTPEKVREAGLNVLLILDRAGPVDLAERGPFVAVWIEGALPADDPLLQRMLCRLTGSLFIQREFTPVSPAQALWRRGLRSIVRGHEVPQEDLIAGNREIFLARFRRAMRERGIRVLVLSPIPGEDAEQTLDYYRAVVAQATAAGFEQGAPLIPPPEWGRSVPFLLHLGVAALLLLVLLRLLPHLPIACLLLTAAVVAIGAMTIFHGIVCHGAGIGGIHLAQVSGQLLALLAPIYGSLLLTQRHGSGWLSGVRLLFVFSALSLSAALLLSAILSHPAILLNVFQFRGVRLALSLPPIIGASIIIQRTEWREWKGLLCAPKSRRTQIVTISLLIACLALIAYILLRSGTIAVLVSDAERRVRVLLETLLYARPRFKEFLLGHPLLFLFGTGAGFSLRPFRYRPLLLPLLLLFGLFGQTSIMNTFAHAHTPFLFSLLRTANSLLLGLLTGTALYLAVLFILRVKQKAIRPRG
ncbi:DUF5693 family protein [Candidatus Bipolaricaulota bacterium]|nr:DUF5693 family protein [Candidatus Bipolaricaulota bacterium]